MAVVWEILNLAFHLCCLPFAVLIVCVPVSFGVWDRIWNSFVSVSDHCLSSTVSLSIPYGPRHEKTCLRGFPTG